MLRINVQWLSRYPALEYPNNPPTIIQKPKFVKLKSGILYPIWNKRFHLVPVDAADEISSIMICTYRHAELSSFLLASCHGHKTGLKTECACGPHMSSEEGKHLLKVFLALF